LGTIVFEWSLANGLGFSNVQAQDYTFLVVISYG
jgi:hypothetical protein